MSEVKLLVRKKKSINVKGISYPVQTYEVTGFLDLNKNLFEKNIPGLSLSLDKTEIEDNDSAIKLLSDVLKKLKSSNKK